jgi:serine/threonine-protein kinase
MQYLGSGARSTIWQIKDCRKGQVYALKRVIKRQSSDNRFLEQAENEYQVSQSFDHPSIRKILRIRRVKRWLSLREIHLFMEFCPGTTIQERRPQDVARIVNVFIQVADALMHINHQGFVHADMKPNNILVDETGNAKIIDLGQSCPIGTTKQRIQGTPDFIAPEQVHRKPLDARTDVYNFGAALYWALAGKPIPTVLANKRDGVQQLNDLAVTPPDELNPDIPSSLSKLILDCIQLRPQSRPASMEKVHSRLELVAYMLSRPETRQADPAGETREDLPVSGAPDGVGEEEPEEPLAPLPPDAIPDSIDDEIDLEMPDQEED